MGGRFAASMAACALLAACAGSPGPGRPPPGTGPGLGPGPACDAPGVIAQILREAEARRGPTGRPLGRVLAMEGVRETGFVGTVDPADPWRWCVGRAVLASGARTEARWILRKRPGAGGPGLDFGWCVAGLSHVDCGHLAP